MPSPLPFQSVFSAVPYCVSSSALRADPEPSCVSWAPLCPWGAHGQVREANTSATNASVPYVQDHVIVHPAPREAVRGKGGLQLHLSRLLTEPAREERSSSQDGDTTSVWRTEKWVNRWQTLSGKAQPLGKGRLCLLFTTVGRRGSHQAAPARTRQLPDDLTHR